MLFLCRALNNLHTKVCFSHCWFHRNHRYSQSFGQTPSATKQDVSAFLAIEAANAVDKTEAYALRDISFDINVGQLIVVTGPPGSGKSTLLSAVVNQFQGPTVCCQGTVPLFMSSGGAFFRDNLNLPFTTSCALSKTQTGSRTKQSFLEEEVIAAPVGFVDQRPWLCGGSVRENILFGEAYDPELYDRVVKACALEKDIDTWHGGDQWILGEGGAPLSGGQQTRVCIARAVYVCLKYEEKAKIEMTETVPKDSAISDLRKQLLQVVLTADTLLSCRRPTAQCCQQLKDLESNLLQETNGLEQSVKAQLFSSLSCCLYCFDDAFTVLDVSVASSIFNNLFGPGGILSHAAILLTLNEQTLGSIMSQPECQWIFAQEACSSRIAEEYSFEPQANVGCRVPLKTQRGLQTQILRIVKGEVIWRGTPTAYNSLVKPLKQRSHGISCIEGESIENIITSKAGGQKQESNTSVQIRADGGDNTIQTATHTAEGPRASSEVVSTQVHECVETSTYRGGIRTLVDTPYVGNGVVNLETYRW